MRPNSYRGKRIIDIFPYRFPLYLRRVYLPFIHPKWISQGHAIFHCPLLIKRLLKTSEKAS